MLAPTSFGQWLKQRRKALDLTRADLAGRIGCAAITITKMEADERRPSRQMAELLAVHLNIPPDQRAAFITFARGEVAESVAPWGTPFHPPSNLPMQPTPLIGREHNVITVCKRLLQPELRLLTLIGPPGIGKTRLALEVARQTLDEFADGVFFVALAPITDASLVLATIAHTLGVLDVGPQTPLERLKVFLRDKQMLLVLDNFEQILAAAAQIAELLTECPWLKLLVTSRAPLRIRQERQIPVPPLVIPNHTQQADIESVPNYSAVTLFIERAQAVKPDFSLTQDNVPIVVAICARLDGLPLAIELISARVKLLSPSALLERLHGRLMLQSDGLRDIEPRHRTLNAAIDWSFQLLNAEEQVLFRRLGIFVGGWRLDAAEAICTESLTLNLLDGMASLLDKNLLVQDTRADGVPRFTMLETIREYAYEQLAASGELGHLQRQHAAYFLALAETVHTALTSVQMGLWWDRLEVEHPNFRAALAWSRTAADHKTELRLSLALGGFWHLRGHMSEGSGWLVDALTRTAEGAGSEPLTAADRALRARALALLGLFGQLRGDLDTSQAHLEESLSLFRELEDSAGIADVLGDYGMLFVLRGDYEQAEVALHDCLTLWRELGNIDGIALIFLFLGNLAYARGNITQAGMLWEESLTLFQAQGNTWVTSTLLTQRAMIALENGNYRRASESLVESLMLLREMGEVWQTAHTLEVFACLAAAQGQQAEDGRSSLLRSARIFGAAELLRETIASPALRFLRQFNERSIAILRVQLDEKAFKATWAEGKTMTLDQVINYALEDRSSSVKATLDE